MTALKFRNIDASPDDPVETWPFEGILAAVERGTLPDWRRLAKAIEADPWGPVAQQVLEAVHLSRPYGTTELLEAVVERARKDAADAERAEVESELRRLVQRAGTEADPAACSRTAGAHHATSLSPRAGQATTPVTGNSLVSEVTPPSFETD
ncbi:MAG TPA: hypothetical protein VF060_28430 [Trebonia sp.]